MPKGNYNNKRFSSSIREILSKNRHYLFYKYFPTSIMLLLSAYINSFLRGVKDSVLVPSLGAELISFIKFYGVFPGTLLFFICFTKLSNILPRDKLYYVINLFFGCFFICYAFGFAPYHHYFEPDLSNLISAYPSFKYQLMLVQHWPTSLLYIMCEICGTVTLTLLFWQFANDLYTIQEAKKTYALFGIIGQSGITFAGIIQTKISHLFTLSQYKEFVWEYTLKTMMITVLLAQICLIFIYRWMYKNVYFNPVLCKRSHSGEREKIKLSVKESLKYICSSKYLWLIMLIVFCYGVGVNLIESFWKDQLKHKFTDHHSYSAFMGQFNIYFGLTSIFVMLCGSYIIRKFKWLFSALVTPFGAGITGSIFFTLIIFKNQFSPLLDSFGVDVLTMAVMLGSVQVILFKSLNYTFVDSTKEMAFMPLDRELKTKGKAAVDVIGGRFGKAFGAISQQLMFQFINPSISNLACELFIYFIIIMIIWTLSVMALNKKFINIVDNATH